MPAPRHEGDFEGEPLPRPPSFDEGDVSDKPAWIRARQKLSPETIAYLEALHENRLESLQSVDEIFPRLIETLRENKALENTFIVFTSDNGYHMGHHRLPAGKWMPYEEDIRVPLVIRGPGVPEGQKIEEFALNNDFAPTFADLAGMKPSPMHDGSSLAPLLGETPPENWRSAFLVEEAEKEVARRPELTAIRTKNSIYIEYVNGEREFYDLERDPFQLENKYETADPDVLRRMENRLEELRNCEGEDCRIAEGF
jgi:arylsulfatase A-like enzyme